MTKKIVCLSMLALAFSGCLHEYPENKIYGDGLNRGRAFDKSMPIEEQEAYNFNAERIQVLDEYFDQRAGEILRDKGAHR